MANQNNAEPILRTGDISELVILTVLDVLGRAPVSLLLESLQIATEHAKAPFSIGPSLEEVLKWRERLNEVEEEETGNQKVYRITGEGRDTVQHYRALLDGLFPSIANIRPDDRPAAR